MISGSDIEAHSISYPAEFGMNLERDPFQWFLLSVLFGARISEKSALRTFRVLRDNGVVTAQKIREAGKDGLVLLLDEGGYARYDFKTAAKLLEMARNLEQYGSLNGLHSRARNFGELLEMLKGLAKGIGDVTVGIFLREMVGIWDKALPYPGKLPMRAADMLGIDPFSYHKRAGVSYGRLESFLASVGRLCLRGDCGKCPFREECVKYRKSAGSRNRAAP